MREFTQAEIDRIAAEAHQRHRERYPKGAPVNVYVRRVSRPDGSPIVEITLRSPDEGPFDA